ncbi:MAG: hypothetical protein WBE20_09215 [Candidatus Acidiferrales bacterium]
MNSKFRLALVFTALFIFAASTARITSAAPAAGGCSMLTPAQIGKVLGQPFGAPAETKAPPAYGNQPWGSHCEYSSQKQSNATVTFIVYVDASPSEAKQTFDKLAFWYRPKSKPAIGDEAYIDAQGAIHVLKGKVRFYLSISSANEKQTTDLAAAIAKSI